MAIRWLLKENRPGKVAVIIYMKSAGNLDKLRVGRKFFRIIRYDLDRPTTGTQDRATIPELNHRYRLLGGLWVVYK